MLPNEPFTRYFLIVYVTIKSHFEKTRKACVEFIKDAPAQEGGKGYHNVDMGRWSKLIRSSPKHKTSLIKTYFFCCPYPVYFQNVLASVNKSNIFQKSSFIV